MKKLTESFILLTALCSNKLFLSGFGLVLLVSVWDILKCGWMDFFEYQILAPGVMLIWVGLALMITAWVSDRRLR